MDVDLSKILPDGPCTEDLVGQTVYYVDQGHDEITFHLHNGWRARFYHSQDCCENVGIEDVNGDWADLIGVPLLVAEERMSTDVDNPPPGAQTGDYLDSATWTFYTFRTIKGSVDVRWGGYSNGYYSECVDFTIFKED